MAAEQWEYENVYLDEGEKVRGWICGRTKERVGGGPQVTEHLCGKRLAPSLQGVGGQVCVGDEGATRRKQSHFTNVNVLGKYP